MLWGCALPFLCMLFYLLHLYSGLCQNVFNPISSSTSNSEGLFSALNSQYWFGPSIVPCQVRRPLQTAEGTAWSCISPCLGNSSTLARWGSSGEILHVFLLQKLIYKLRTTTLSISES